MRTHLRLIAAAALMILPATAFAQADAHHPDTDTAAAAPATESAPAPALTSPAPGQTTGNMPGQGMDMMQMMQMMQTMQGNMMQMMQMMQGGMMQGMQGGAGGMAMGGTGMSDAGKAYTDAMMAMNGTMLAGAQAGDPDVAFVKAMIPHHQGAIDMAKAVLQYGKDDRVKEWANQIIKAEETEMAAMQMWLKGRGQ